MSDGGCVTTGTHSLAGAVRRPAGCPAFAPALRPDRPQVPGTRRREKLAEGFTLIEILIAVLILAIVLSTVYASYTGTFRVIRQTQADAEVYSMARNFLDRITRDLESAAPWKGAFTFRAEAMTLGDRDFTRLVFRASAHVAFREREVPGGIAVIEYGVEEGTEKAGVTLRRSDSLYRDPEKEEPPGGGFLLCDRVEALSCLFYDENGKEYETWDSAGQVEAQKKKAPAAVLVKLSLVNEADRERPYLFMTRVRLPFHRVEVP
jgi:general secretion pathway protein J